MENLKVSELADGFFQFGILSDVLRDKTHITQTRNSNGLTLCGTPITSDNWAEIYESQVIGCQKCLSKYSDLNVIPKVKEPKCELPLT